MMQQLAAVFERDISDHPEDWHMLQRVFVTDLDKDRSGLTRNGANVGQEAGADRPASAP